MSIDVAEISRIIKQQIEGVDTGLDTAEVGTVLAAGDGIARVYGLDNCMAGELLDFPHGVSGVVLNLEEDSIGVALLGKAMKNSRGRRSAPKRAHCGGARRAGPRRPRGQRAGRARGRPRRHLRRTHPSDRNQAPGIVARQPVREPLQTGLLAIDAMTPIGRGQRELIIGDRQTGKTAIAIDAILNQKEFYDNGVTCFLYLCCCWAKKFYC